jgi:hypothetical protein
LRRRTHSPSRQVEPIEKPNPSPDPPAEEDPIQVSVNVVVNCGAIAAGTVFMLWLAGKMVLLVVTVL